MIHYIVAVYVGKRANRIVNDLLIDPTYMVKQHIDALTSLNLPQIKKITFVVSPSDSLERDQRVLNFINDQRHLLDKYEVNAVMSPNNDNHSYGSWNFAMNASVDYDDLDFFLIEDDYFPAKDEFYIPFYEQVQGKTAYICQFYDSGAAISNGLLLVNSARIHHEKFGNCINIEPHKIMLKRGDFMMVHRDAGVYSQIHFLDKFHDMKFFMGDVAKNYCQPFFNRKGDICLYGNVKGEVLIKPVTYNDSHRSTYKISNRAHQNSE